MMVIAHTLRLQTGDSKYFNFLLFNAAFLHVLQLGQGRHLSRPFYSSG